VVARTEMRETNAAVCICCCCGLAAGERELGSSPQRTLFPSTPPVGRWAAPWWAADSSSTLSPSPHTGSAPSTTPGCVCERACCIPVAAACCREAVICRAGIGW
jgi:hypothetical protein